MEFKIKPPPLSVNGTAMMPSTTSIAETFNANRERYAALTAPITIRELLVRTGCLNYMINFQQFHREFVELDPALKASVLTALLDSPAQCNPNLGLRSSDIINGRITYSEDLFTNKHGPDGQFYIMAPVANIIEQLMYGSMTRRFNWQLIFYAMGFNPRKLIEEQKALEQSAKDALSGNTNQK